MQKYIKDFESKLEKLTTLKQNECRDKNKVLMLIEEMASKPKYDISSTKKLN